MKTTKQTTLLLVGALLVGVAVGLWLGGADEQDAYNGDTLQVAADQHDAALADPPLVPRSLPIRLRMSSRGCFRKSHTRG